MMNKRIQEAFEKWFNEDCDVTEHKDQFEKCYLAALPKWVSVEDQLPVLRDGVACARFLTIPITGEGPVIMLYFADDQRWSQFSDDTQMVTHWQPLPPVPVEGDE